MTLTQQFNLHRRVHVSHPPTFSPVASISGGRPARGIPCRPVPATQRTGSFSPAHYPPPPPLVDPTPALACQRPRRRSPRSAKPRLAHHLWRVPAASTRVLVPCAPSALAVGGAAVATAAVAPPPPSPPPRLSRRRRHCYRRRRRRHNHLRRRYAAAEACTGWRGQPFGRRRQRRVAPRAASPPRLTALSMAAVRPTAIPTSSPPVALPTRPRTAGMTHRRQ